MSKETRYAVMVMTEEGTWFWVLVEPEGWVEATSQRVTNQREPEAAKPPEDVKTWASEASARKFAMRWTGHPWWCKPNGHYKIIEVKRLWKKVSAGFANIGEVE